MIKAVSFSLLAVVLIGACGGPAASPSPASPTPAGPTPGVSPTGSPSPTDQPTPTPVATPAQTPPPDGIDHPTGADELVLQYEVGGGFVPFEFFITQAPQFSLYGDGAVIWRPQQDAGRIGLPGGALPRFLQGRMDEDAVQALLAFALGQGRLAGARETYPQNSCADCPTTIFRINADGMSKTVTIDALGIEAQMDAADRAGFLVLSEWLNNFDAQAANGVAGDVVHYDPPLYRVVLSEAQPEMGEPAEWPWPEVDIDEFESLDAGWQRRAVLTREQVAVITEVPSGGVASILVEDPDGELWTVGVRPLLPEEIAALD
jgi:hypothetical protein